MIEIDDLKTELQEKNYEIEVIILFIIIIIIHNLFIKLYLLIKN